MNSTIVTVMAGDSNGGGSSDGAVVVAAVGRLVGKCNGQERALWEPGCTCSLLEREPRTTVWNSLPHL